jgi:hypothetical protein
MGLIEFQMLRVAPMVVAKYDRASVVKAEQGNLGGVPQDALLRAGEPVIAYPGRDDVRLPRRARRRQEKGAW